MVERNKIEFLFVCVYESFDVRYILSRAWLKICFDP